MRRAEGFITADGTFFVDEKEAELYEAEMRLRGMLSTTFPNINQDQFFAVVLNLSREIGDYINAHKAADKRDLTEGENRGETDGGEEAQVDHGLGHISSTEEDLASLLKLPTRGPEHVSNVGSRSRSKKIPDRRKVDGA